MSGCSNKVALSTLPDLKGWRVFLCGNPNRVNQTKRLVFMKGTSMSDIYTDAFVLSHTST